MESIKNNISNDMKKGVALFSIRYKFLFATTSLLLICVFTYLGLATTVFKDDKTELVFDYNRSTVKNLASDLDGYFERLKDKAKLYAFLSGLNTKQKKLAIDQLIAKNSDLVFMAVSLDYKNFSGVEFENKDFFQTYGINRKFITNDLEKSRPVPFAKIQEEGEALWNASIDGGPALIGYGRSVVLNTEKGIPYKQFALINYLKADPLLKAVSRGQLSEVFVVTSDGQVLAHGNEKTLFSGLNMKDSPLMKKVSETPANTSVLEYEEDGHAMLGAFSKAFSGKVLILSRISEEKAFGVVHQFIWQSIQFALIVLTISFIAAILFSRSLVGPLEHLTQAMRRVSAGFLDSQIKVHTKDEISVLANSFNFMIADLKSSRLELLEVNQNLENKVKERTTQLEKQNQAVKQAQETLLRTTRLAAVGEIAGQAAHEVLNPLTSMISRIQKIQGQIKKSGLNETKLLDEIYSAWSVDYDEGGFQKLVENWEKPSALMPDQSLWQEDIKNIKDIQSQLTMQLDRFYQDTEFLLRESHRINKIVQSMRSMNVIHAEKRECSLHETIKESIQVMADLADKMGIEVLLIANADQDHVLIDSDEFIQALTNLIRNALQSIQEYIKISFSPEFKGVVSLRTYNEDNQIFIEVKDNGIGMSEKHKEKLFEAQFTTKSKEEGTGIGLSISRRFIRAFGGDIWLESSTKNEGCLFLIKVPLIQPGHRKVSA